LDIKGMFMVTALSSTVRYLTNVANGGSRKQVPLNIWKSCYHERD